MRRYFQVPPRGTWQCYHTVSHCIQLVDRKIDNFDESTPIMTVRGVNPIPRGTP